MSIVSADREPIDLPPPTRDALVAHLSSAPVGVAQADRDSRSRLGNLILVGADIAALMAAFIVAGTIFGANDPETNRVSVEVEFLLFLATLPVWLFGGKVYGLYDREESRINHTTSDEIVTILHLVTMGVWLVFLVLAFSNLSDPGIARIATFWLLAIVFLISARAIVRAVTGNRLDVQDTIIVGTGDVAQRVARKLRSHPEWGRNLLGFVDFEPVDRSDDLLDVPILGHPTDLPSLVGELGIDRVVIAFSPEHHEQTLDQVFALRAAGVHVDIVPRLFETIAPGVDVHSMQGLPLIGLPPLRRPSRAKAFFDVVGAALGLIVLAPAILAFALMVKLDSRGPAFYSSERIGMNGRIFRALKFRTMAQEYCRGPEYGGAEAEVAFSDLMDDIANQQEFEQTHKLRIDPRVTRVGRWLRRSSLDELPQLVNVLRRQMSLVGPRPVTVDEFLLLHTPREDGRGTWTSVEGYWQLRNVRPGLTGLWQVSGRSGTGYDERVQLDKLYAATFSLRSDFVIVAKTVHALLSRSGAS